MDIAILVFGVPSRPLGGAMILGSKVVTPTKVELARSVAHLLGIEEVRVSSGSTIVSDLLTRIAERLSGQPADHLDAYQKAATALELLGLTYDPFWDTSEAQERGGSTVTARAYSRMRTALTRVPRCFVLNRTDAREGASWETDDTRVYRYDRTVTGRRPLNDAGPGSLIVYYNTSSASSYPMHYTASARVEYIRPGWRGPWEAVLIEYEPFPFPVPGSEVQILGRNPQHAITEIEKSLFDAIVEAGRGSGGVAQKNGRAAGHDLGGIQAASRVDLSFPVREIAIEGDDVPEPVPTENLDVTPLREPVYTETGDGDVVGDPSRGRRAPADREVDRLVERRAIEAAKRHLGNLGWSVVADRQRAGVGYDLEMMRDGRALHVEVKGMRGGNIEFNMTAKEWWRAREDPLFVVAAVTDVLSPSGPRVNVLGRDEVVRAERTPTQYRVAVHRGRVPDLGA